MITETTTASEQNETAMMMQTGVTDEIKRNHLRQQEINPISDDIGVTDFTLKFARLKKALRKRSSTIF